MKKAQIQAQVFVYVLAMLVIALVLLYGYRSINTMKERANQVDLLAFKNDMTKSIEKVSNDYGTVRVPTFNIPKEYKEVCFIDIDNNGMKEFFYNKRCNDYGSCVDFRKINDCDYFYLANNSTVIKNTEVYKEKCKHFINFYNKNFLLSQFKNSSIIDDDAHFLLL